MDDLHRRNQRAIHQWEDKWQQGPDEPDNCEDGECGTCPQCKGELRAWKEEERADAEREERILARREQ